MVCCLCEILNSNHKARRMSFENRIDRVRVLGSTNTQTRRLGYVATICETLGFEYVPAVDLQRRVEDWADRNNEKLRTHVSDRGEMRRSAQSLSFKRYLELAQNLQLVAEVSGYLRLTKSGRVLIVAKGLKVNEVSPFHIKNEMNLLFLYQLLLLDADYLLPILELTTHYQQQSELLENSQACLWHHFDLMQAYARSPIPRSEIIDRSKAIAQWTKPVKYLEHLLLPRLHWLLDLGLLDWDVFGAERQFEPSKWGDRLLQSVPRLEGEPLVDRSWCQNVLVSAWAEEFKPSATRWLDVPEAHKQSSIKNYVEDGFGLFRTMRYPRISAYQVVLFIVLRLLFDEGIVAGFEDIKQALDKFSQIGDFRWSFFWSAVDDDGYLLLSE